MTAAVVSPLLGAAAVNGLCGLLVLNGVPCPTSCKDGKSYWWCDIDVDEYIRQAEQCRTCGGSGSVSPSVSPGQRLDIATTRTDPGLDSDSPHMDGSWHWSWNKYPDRPGKTGARFNAEASAVLRKGVHLGSVVGSVTATTPALPIADARDGAWTAEAHGVGDHLCIRDDDTLVRFRSDQDPGTDLSCCLPWLGDDLVGRWAVLIDNPAPVLGHDSHYVYACSEGHQVISKRPTLAGEPCSAVYGPGQRCRGRVAAAPVPLPDGVDLTEGTIVEVDL